MTSYVIAVAFVLMVVIPGLVGARTSSEEQPRRRRSRHLGPMPGVVSTRALHHSGSSAIASPRVVVVPYAATVGPRRTAGAHVAAAPPVPKPETLRVVPAAQPYLACHIRPAIRASRPAAALPDAPPPMQPPAVMPRPTSAQVFDHSQQVQGRRPKQDFWPAPTRPRAVAGANSHGTEATPHIPFPPAKPLPPGPWRETAYAEPGPVQYLTGNPHRSEASTWQTVPSALLPGQQLRSTQPSLPNVRQEPWRESLRHNRPRVRRTPAPSYPSPHPEVAGHNNGKMYLQHAPRNYGPSPVVSVNPTSYRAAYQSAVAPRMVQTMPQIDPYTGHRYPCANVPAAPPQTVTEHANRASASIPVEYVYDATGNPVGVRRFVTGEWVPLPAAVTTQVFRG